MAFFLLLAALTGGLCLAAGVYETGAAFLDRCRESYTTIARFTYTGGTGEPGDFYPAVEAAREALKLPADSTLVWDPARVTLGRLEGVTRTDQDAPSSTACVLVVKPSGYDADRNLYSAYVIESLYAQRDRTDQLVYIDGQGLELEKGRYYLIHGTCFFGFGGIINVAVEPPVSRPDLADVPMAVDVTTADGYDLSGQALFQTLADYHREVSSFVTVTATADLLAWDLFHQNQLTLSQGRGFTAGDGRVAVLSRELADDMGWQVGDWVKLSLTAKESRGLYESYWPADGFDDTGKFEIVGLFTATAEHRYAVYIPSDASPAMENAQSGTVLGQATVDNEKARDFYARIMEDLPDQVQLTMLDQGYAAAAAPFTHMLQAAGMVLLACVVAAVAALSLFGYLFVYRQGTVVKNMRRLGTGSAAVTAYFLSGAGTLAFLAALAGLGLAKALSQPAEALVLRLLTGSGQWEAAYSISNLGVHKTLAYTPAMSWKVFCLAAGLLFLGAMVSCLFFAFLRMEKPGGRRKNVRVHRGPSRSLRGGSWKFAALSALRGGGRTWTPIAVLLCAVILLGALPFTLADYSRQRAALDRETEIMGYCTNSDARYTEGLSLSADNLKPLYDSEYIDDLTVTYDGRYEFAGAFDGAGQYRGRALELPQGAFSMEIRLKQLLDAPKLVVTNGLALTPELQYADWSVQWLEGCDEASLQLRPIPRDMEAYRAVVPAELLAEHGLSLGDRVVVEMSNGLDIQYYSLDLIGAYSLPNQQGTIYVEMGFYFGDHWEDLEPYLDQMLNRFSFRSAAFHVRAADLPVVRTVLRDLGYSQVGTYDAGRRWVVLDDRSYLDTARSLDRRLDYMNALFPVLYLLTELLAPAAAWILTSNHKKDLAVMRSQGASRRTGFWSLCFQQLYLCVLGVGLGCGVLAGLGAWTVEGGYLTGLFTALWLLGSAAAIARMNQREIVKMMKAAE